MHCVYYLNETTQLNAMIAFRDQSVLKRISHVLNTLDNPSKRMLLLHNQATAPSLIEGYIQCRRAFVAPGCACYNQLYRVQSKIKSFVSSFHSQSCSMMDHGPPSSSSSSSESASGRAGTSLYALNFPQLFKCSFSSRNTFQMHLLSISTAASGRLKYRRLAALGKRAKAQETRNMKLEQMAT